MNLAIETLSKIYAEHILLEITESDLREAELAAQDYSNQTGKNNAYINYLCLNAFLNLAEVLPRAKTRQCVAEVVATAAQRREVWEFINGVEISLNERRLVLIPSDALDVEDFAIPQEWVDIPNLAADYYLPIQVDIENRFLHIWGFVSRRTLKEKADRDPIYRIYYLERDFIIPNLDSLWVACEFCAEEKGEVLSLPILKETETENLIEKLSQPSPYSPRLEIKFEEWGALLNESCWLEKLYQQRLAKVKAKRSVKQGVNLREWLTQNFTEAIEAEWLNINTFGKIEPVMGIGTRNKHSPNLIKRAKLLNLKLQMAEIAIVLLIAVTPESDGKSGVLVQAHPTNGERYLPANLSITLLSDTEENLQSTVARERDNYIQLCYFRCPPETSFSIAVSLKEVTVTENFVI